MYTEFFRWLGRSVLVDNASFSMFYLSILWRLVVLLTRILTAF